jgi:hypothetical protein
LLLSQDDILMAVVSKAGSPAISLTRVDLRLTQRGVAAKTRNPGSFQTVVGLVMFYVQTFAHHGGSDYDIQHPKP